MRRYHQLALQRSAFRSAQARHRRVRPKHRLGLAGQASDSGACAIAPLRVDPCGMDRIRTRAPCGRSEDGDHQSFRAVGADDESAFERSADHVGREFDPVRSGHIAATSSRLPGSSTNATARSVRAAAAAGCQGIESKAPGWRAPSPPGAPGCRSRNEGYGRRLLDGDGFHGAPTQKPSTCPLAKLSTM
jgi:hypothetical protein